MLPDGSDTPVITLQRFDRALEHIGWGWGVMVSNSVCGECGGLLNCKYCEGSGQICAEPWDCRDCHDCYGIGRCSACWYGQVVNLIIVKHDESAIVLPIHCTELESLFWSKTSILLSADKIWWIVGAFASARLSCAPVCSLKYNPRLQGYDCLIREGFMLAQVPTSAY